jgi:Leucine-rich repeat (LRR) protein
MSKDNKEDFLESLSKYESFDSITHLDISHKKIKQIKVLPKNLTELNCSHNQLNRLFDENCNIPETLIKINCSYNQIVNFDIPSLKDKLLNLVELDCSFNKLAFLDLSRFNKLKTMNCSYNQIESILLPDSVENVIMDKNKISGILEFKPNMKILSANKNLITECNFNEIPGSLKKLYLNKNLIRKIIQTLNDKHFTYICPYIEMKNNPLEDREEFNNLEKTVSKDILENTDNYELRAFRFVISRINILL